jgi:3'-phosphoadenosine 5'-phosphosulfate (PAPS) 3'-phosphatase
VVEEAGGSMTDLGGKPIVYNKESLKHEGFVVTGDPRVRAMMEGPSGRRGAG